MTVKIYPKVTVSWVQEDLRFKTNLIDIITSLPSDNRTVVLRSFVNLY